MEYVRLVELYNISKNQGTLTASFLSYAKKLPPSPPNITAQPVGPVRENDFVEIECQSKNGNPPPNISWFFTNGSEVVSVSVSSMTFLSLRQENASRVQEATKSWIKFFVTPSENGAVVLCRVNNDATSSTNEKAPDAATAPLNVVYSPRVTVSPSSPYNTEIGGQAFFTCSADSNPPPTKMEWTLNDEVLAGSDGHAPVIKVSDEYRGAVGKPITIFCVVDASPSATKISWTGPNGFSSDGSSLDIKSLALKDMGNYTCQASNEMMLYGQERVVSEFFYFVCQTEKKIE
uniref:Ig-like domain-containing protein n=1 Tax=Romanomermis culicivorax TaxID=13658 RepID=A0A915HIR4_ROMCU